MNASLINGRYSILAQIGAGGFGFTYLAEDVSMPARPRVVVKHLRPQLADQASIEIAARLFNQEAEVLYRLGRHPNIPALIAHFKDRGEFFLVQEFVDGHTLDREFATGRLYQPAEVVSLVGQMLETLAFVHAEGVIHRDVKPANLIRRASDGAIELIDFGAVRQIGAPNESNAIAIGSHGYMSREQMAGAPNFASDLYALGLVAIESVTGLRPLDLPRTPSGEILLNTSVPLPPELARFILKLARVDFRQRYADAAEALQAFNRIADRIGFFNLPSAPPVFAPQHYVVAPTSAPTARREEELPPTVFVSVENRPRLVRPEPVPEKKSSVAAVIVSIVLVASIIGAVIYMRWPEPEPPRPELMARQPIPVPTTFGTPSAEQRKAEQVRLVEENRRTIARGVELKTKASALESSARTKADWRQVSSTYEQAHRTFEEVGQGEPEYDRASRLASESFSRMLRATEQMRNAPK